MLERCPTCGKTIGTLMESHPNKPGLIEILSSDRNEPQRIVVIAALCLLAVLAIVATELIFR